jgi:hypothetical protein
MASIMEAQFKSGKKVTGKLAETLTRIGLAKKKRGNIQNLKHKKKAVTETPEE